MRYFIDGLIVVSVVAAGVWYLAQRHERVLFEERQAEVRAALLMLTETTTYQRDLQHAWSMVDAEGSHRTPSPEHGTVVLHSGWFEGELPRNALTAAAVPWMDVAPYGDDQLHPPDPIFHDAQQAGFWFSARHRVFRARVPHQGTDEKTLDLYNAVNGTLLTALPRSTEPARSPLAYALGEPMRLNKPMADAVQSETVSARIPLPVEEVIIDVAEPMPAELMASTSEPAPRSSLNTYLGKPQPQARVSVVPEPEPEPQTPRTAKRRSLADLLRKRVAAEDE